MRNKTYRLLQAPLLATGLLALSACGDVEVGANAEFPKPLIDPLPVKLGIYYSEEFKRYQHAEERWGVEWKVELGKYHVDMADKLFEAAFRDTVSLKAPADGQSSDVRAVIEPRIEQYSFITPRDTGAKYYAVTIRYRLNIFAPDGRLADSLTFTGYGSSPSSGMTSTNPMLLATRKAMRDAAAKFLVQFPDQDVAKKLVAGLPLSTAATQAAGGDTSGASPSELETVPIIDAQPQGTPSTTSAPAPGGTQAPAGSDPAPSTAPSGSGDGTPPLVPPGETKDQESPAEGSDKPPAQQPPPENAEKVPPDAPGAEASSPEASSPEASSEEKPPEASRDEKLLR